MTIPIADAVSAVPPSAPGFEEEALPHLNAVYLFALRLAGGREAEADDLVQETFLRAYRAWKSYTTGTNIRAWLLTICRNVFLRREERRGRRPEVAASEIDADIESLAPAAALSGAEAADPERRFFDSFVDREVMDAVDGLAGQLREVVVLSDLEGLSYAETADVLGVPIGTVKSRLFRGRRLLQRALFDYARDMGYIRGRRRP